MRVHAVRRLQAQAIAVVLQVSLAAPADPPPGCHFHTRCAEVFDRCRREVPDFYPVEDGGSRCFLHESQRPDDGAV